MARFLHSVNVQERLIAADGVQQFDLAVNPLSVLLLHLKPLNDTGTLADFETYLGICAAINRVAVLWNGVSVISMSGRDAAAMAFFRHGIVPLQGNHDITTNERRSVVLPIFLGREAYDPRSCFPATKRGELVLELDFDIADVGYDGLRFAVESIELLGAKPKEYERKVQLGATFGATGINDIELPIGNLVRGLLLFGTTAFSGASPSPTFGRVATYVDNEQVGFSAHDFEVAHMMSVLMGGQPPIMDDHAHVVDATSANTEEITVGTHFVGSSDGWENYAMLNFDPTQDDLYTLSTRGANRFHLEANVETANAWRVVPIEVIKV